MPCHPYKSIRTPALAVRGPLRAPFALAVVAFALLIHTPLHAPAQWDYDPEWGTYSAPGDAAPFPYETYWIEDGLPYDVVEWPDGQAGPMLPAIIVDEPPPTITSYPPAIDEAVSPGDSCLALQSIPGHVRVVVPETFLNRLFARRDTDAGPVTDFVLGANVTGSQNTETCVTFDVKPSAGTLRILVQLAGTTLNQTIGVTPQAAVRSRGTHDFKLIKQVDFDGLMFTTRTPAAWVTPQLTNEAAETALSGVPLIGPVANQVALTQADRRRPEAEQIAARRVTDQAAPRFNSEVDQKLADANRRLPELIRHGLQAVGLAPGNLVLGSTEDRLLLGLTLPVTPTPSATPTDAPLSVPGVTSQAVEGEEGFIVIRESGQHAVGRPAPGEARTFGPPPPVGEGAALTIAVHEDSINSLLAQLGLGGRRIPDRTLDRLLEVLAEVLSADTMAWPSFEGIGGEAAEFATIVLDTDEPLAVRFDDGQIMLQTRSAFQPALGAAVPAQQIRMSFSLSADDGKLTLVPGDVSVTGISADDEDPVMELARPIIREQIAKRLEPLPVPTSIPLSMSGLPSTTLIVRQVTLADGWLVIAID